MTYHKRFNYIQKRIDEVNKKLGRQVLSLGYIGHCDAHMDDRKWIVWVNDLRYPNGNLKSLWSATADELLAVQESAPTRAANRISAALIAIEAFSVGVEASGAIDWEG
jgi:hypothetical protein